MRLSSCTHLYLCNVLREEGGRGAYAIACKSLEIKLGEL